MKRSKRMIIVFVVVIILLLIIFHAGDLIDGLKNGFGQEMNKP